MSASPPSSRATRRAPAAIITLEDRINGCFLRSMNGKPLPVDGADMKAMVAYFDWMKGATKPEDKVAGRGVGKVDTTLQARIRTTARRSTRRNARSATARTAKA